MTLFNCFVIFLRKCTPLWSRGFRLGNLLHNQFFRKFQFGRLHGKKKESREFKICEVDVKFQLQITPDTTNYYFYIYYLLDIKESYMGP